MISIILTCFHLCKDPNCTPVFCHDPESARAEDCANFRQHQLLELLRCIKIKQWIIFCNFWENLIKLAPGDRRKQTADETCNKLGVENHVLKNWPLKLTFDLTRPHEWPRASWRGCGGWRSQTRQTHNCPWLWGRPPPRGPPRWPWPRPPPTPRRGSGSSSPHPPSPLLERRVMLSWHFMVKFSETMCTPSRSSNTGILCKTWTTHGHCTSNVVPSRLAGTPGLASSKGASSSP